MTKKIDIEATQEKIANAKLSLFGWDFSPTQLGLGFGILSSVIATLYGGFVMYQKVEAIAGLDIEAFQTRMDMIEQQVTAINQNTDSIKIDLKADIKRAEDTADDSYRFVKEVNKDLNDELRGFRKDMKELEDRITDKLDKALSNPLAD